jgi:hypothetical protein
MLARRFSLMNKSKNKFGWLSSDFTETPPQEDKPERPRQGSESKSGEATPTLQVYEGKATLDAVPPAMENKTAEPNEPKRRDGRRSHPDFKVVGVQLSITLHRQAKELLLKQGDEKNFSDLMNELLEEWVKRQR